MTQHATARRRIVGAAAVSLALAGLLTGCSSRPGAAAVVDGQAISTSDVVTVVDELKPAVPDVTATLVLNTLIQEPTLVQLASDKGFGVSADDAKAALDSFFTTNNLTAPTSYSAATLEVGYHQAAAGKLNGATDIATISQEFADRLGKLDVSVNPRFGTWSDNQVGDPVAPTWVVTPPPAQ
ncbi:MAG TPA: hypothetical protein VGC04_07875 [Cellulomonas sp.]